MQWARRWIGETPQATDVRLLLETLVVWLGCCCRPYAALHCCWWERRGIPLLHQAGSEEEWSTRIWRKIPLGNNPPESWPWILAHESRYWHLPHPISANRKERAKRPTTRCGRRLRENRKGFWPPPISSDPKAQEEKGTARERERERERECFGEGLFG